MTIKDIARLAGVTHSTVSRSLNDSPLVAAETKEKIKKLATELGYSPNTFARRLVTKKSNTLGVFFLSRAEINFMENFGTQFLDGIATASSNNGYDLLMFTMTRDLSNQKSYIRLCQEKHVEGVIFIGMTSDDPHLAEIAASQIPVCIIDFELKGDHVGFISSDNDQGIRLALDHLWQNGHRSIAHLGGPEVSPVAMIREDAYRRYMTSHGLESKIKILRGDFTKDSGYRRTQEMIRQGHLPTALLAANDYMALGAVKALKEQGYKIPSDVSIIGYDNVLAGEYSDPGLTTIGQNPIEMGASAVQYLFEKLKGGAPSPIHLINPNLIIRDSVRPIPIR
ncbi:MAG: LacI family DNA-binding transcriptional regulator [Spirochaetales bacterium]|nr:LacI family DNA-binding transcriptional regulator [Spirochaetales bacterium]